MSINRGMEKEMWHTYTTEYYSAMKRNGIESFAEMWMDLETVEQSEVSQIEKNKYVLRHIGGLYRNGTDECVCRAGNRNADIENRHVDIGREEEGGTH